MNKQTRIACWDTLNFYRSLGLTLCLSRSNIEVNTLRYFVFNWTMNVTPDWLDRPGPHLSHSSVHSLDPNPRQDTTLTTWSISQLPLVWIFCTKRSPKRGDVCSSQDWDSLRKIAWETAWEREHERDDKIELDRPEIELEWQSFLWRRSHRACCVLVSGLRMMLKFSYIAETNSGRLKWEKDA